MAKRDLYLEKIHNLFIRLGVDGLTMEDIANHIGVTKMTLYNNFKDKDNLINEILIYRKNAHLSYMHSFEGKNLNAVEMLIAVLEFQKNNPLPTSHLFYKSIKDSYPQQFKILQANARRNMEMFIKHNIYQGINEGIYRNDFNSESIISYIMATMDSVLNHWVLDNREVNLNLTHEQFINYHIRGIANEKGVKILEKYQNDKL